MRILLATPAEPGTQSGNGRTAARYVELWSALGHEVIVTTEQRFEEVELLVALHATKCAAVLDTFAERAPAVPRMVVVAGTDLSGSERARFELSLERASAIVTLQPLALQALPERFAGKARSIVQSVLLPARLRDAQRRRVDCEIALVAGLREVKDPLRIAYATVDLPAPSRIFVTHYGPSLDAELALEANELMKRNPRYRWHGPQPHETTLDLMHRASALCNTSLSEGGANVVSEALALSCPVLCSAIPGNLGVLGSDWPATFTSGSTEALRDLLLRFEADADLRDDLAQRTAHLRELVQPACEREGWAQLFSAMK